MIEDDVGGYIGKLKGMECINLCKFDDFNLVMGVEGLFIGKYVFIESVMLIKGLFL